MITIYHNPRCSKSRQGLSILEENKQDFKIIKYLETPPSSEELGNIIKKLNLKPIDLVRKNEAIWKEQFKGNTYTDKELIDIMVAKPKLIERPIVVHGDKAVLGRPPESIKSII